MKKSEIEERVREIAEKAADSLDLILWDVEYVKEGSDYYLRIYIDKEGGVDIDDCVEMNKRMDPELDKANFIEDAYILEVSSPGLTRKLKTERDYDLSIGRLVHIKLYKAVSGDKEIIATLKGYEIDLYL